MDVQTDKNSIILVAEYAIKILRQTFKLKLGFRPTKSKAELDSCFKKLESLLMTLKYSYLSLDELRSHPDVNGIQDLAEDIAEAIEPAKQTKSTNKMTLSTIEWAISILGGMDTRLPFSSNELGTGIDIRVVRVRNIQQDNKLVQTRAYDDRREYTIMTNLVDIRNNINLAAAFLPPMEVGGKISQAMYLGLDERSEDAGSIVNPASVNLKEVNAILHQLFSKKS
ncbi:MAG: hypothetical protein ACXACU_08700 [Candidatus Hodarchaeales archaeon]|jgi:predicted RNA-binding protein with EMAP domain